MPRFLLPLSTLQKHGHRARAYSHVLRRLPLWLSLAGSLGCGPQKEGERCDLANGNADCDLGLVCRPGSELGLESDLLSTALCCPPSGAEPTRSECGAGISLPSELGMPGAGGSDAGSEGPAASPASDGGARPIGSSPPDAGMPSPEGGSPKPAEEGTEPADSGAPRDAAADAG